MGLEQGESLFLSTGTTPVALTAADLMVFTAPVPCDIIRILGVVTTAFGADAHAIAIDKRITPGSDTGRIDAAGGTMTSSAARAVGTVIYHNCNPIVQLDAGQQCVIQGTDASAAGVAIWFVEYRPRAFVAPRIPTAVEYAT